MTNLTSREKFLKVYVNLPLPVREEVVYIDSNQRPISWNVAYLEILNNTEFGKSILDTLEKLNII
jgi:hypothetical protein